MYKLALTLVHAALLVEGQLSDRARQHNEKTALTKFLLSLNTPTVARLGRMSLSARQERARASSMSSEISRQDLVAGLRAALPATLAAASTLFNAPAKAGIPPGIPPEALGDEEIMSQKAHGTTATSIQENLRFGVDRETADRICSYNRQFAEYAGYWTKTPFKNEFREMATENTPVTFYDSVTGKPLFRAPVGRSVADFLAESEYHGWPSFRDAEVVWDNVRILRKSGEVVSADGTHLGHDIPDRSGNRYCINLVSMSGQPSTST
jgi:peptide methionine sulfoxide reductase MsrB